MKISLKDIIDLDYLITCDNELDSKEDITSRELKDRRIYSQCKDFSKTDRTLLFSWLKLRKEEKGLPVLPGTFFSSLYTSMVYIMVLSGFVAGIVTVYSFLAYHGARPVNVTSFTALFIVLQVILILLSLVLVVLRRVRKKRHFAGSAVNTLLSFLFFKALPKIIQKTGWTVSNQKIDDLEYTTGLMRMKAREYKDLFFWPFFILTSLFAFSFSTGALTGLLFKVIVSDMAFGWQSTLMASSNNVHSLVSYIALPWSWFLPESVAVPSLEQIEGSRIVLKQGIHALATENLVSWWPFLCFEILFYAVMPRCLLIFAGIFVQKQVLKQFNFANPKFRQLLIRMQSPVLNVDSQQITGNQNIEKDSVKNELKTDSFTCQQNVTVGQALMLISKKVYCHETVEQIVKDIEHNLFFKIKKIVGVNFDFDHDIDAVSLIKKSDAKQVILVHEVWQPPIRELIYYIAKIREVIPKGIPLYILLTRDAGQKNLGVDKDDINFKVWEKTVFKLEDPGISVIGFLQS